jgi:hypothetical protein
VSSLPPIEGTLTAKPFSNALAGSISAPVGAPGSGRVGGSIAAPLTGTIAGEGSDSPESSASANVGNLISSLGSLSAQAQSLPLSPPTIPGLPPDQGYRPQSTDYMQFADESN